MPTPSSSSSSAGPRRPVWPRLGVRARVTAAFAIGALALSVVLAVLTYELASGYLIRQRETSTLRQAVVNAKLVQFNLQGVAAGQYRVKLFNHNGTFRTQHDERNALGRVVHVCPAQCTATNLGGCPVCTDPGQSGCFFGTCAAPVTPAKSGRVR